MTMRRSRPETRPSDLVSLAERTWALGAVRASFFAVVLVTTFADARVVGMRPSAVVLVTAAAAGVVGATLFVGRLSRGPAVAVTAFSVLVDGLYLGWIVYVTGGVNSPLRFLILLHVVAVTLLASHRTGLKVAAWHSLVRVVVLHAQAAGILAVVDPSSALPAPGSPFPPTAVLDIVVIWAVALTTAALSNVNERELRAQRAGLEALSEMVRRFDAAESTIRVPRILVETLCSVFGLRRGALLAARDGDFALLAGHGVEEVDAVPRGPDDVMEAAWAARRPLLVRRLDAERDRRLDALLPRARNLIVVPLGAELEARLGVVVLERGGRPRGLRSSVVTMLEEFCAHAWLALKNGWLLDDIRDALEENRALQDKLVEQNESLEQTVAARTAEVTERLQQLQAADASRRALLDKLVTAQEEERSRLAGDIHDDPIQKMVAASMRLQMLRREVTDPEVTETLEHLLETVRTSIASLRHLIFELRPAVLDEEGLAAALRALLDAGTLTYEIRNEMLDEPPPETRVILYRIAQEAIGNVRKHAQTDHVSIALGQRAGGFFVRVADDGVGFGAADIPEPAPGHLGLTSMRERAELAGGWCRVQSLPGNGTVVETWLPGLPSGSPTDADGRREAPTVGPRPSHDAKPVAVPARG